MSLLNESGGIPGISPIAKPEPANEPSPSINLEQELERLALILARTWKDEHPDATSDSATAFDGCVLYVTTEMAKAGSAVGGVAGLTILTGGGSAAAQVVCRRVL